MPGTDNDLSVRLLRDEGLLAVLPDSHPAVRAGHVDLRELA